MENNNFVILIFSHSNLDMKGGILFRVLFACIVAD